MFFLYKFVPFSRFEVRDKSMEPFLCQGDRVLTFNWGKVRSGDIIVFCYFERVEESKNVFMIKRVSKISAKRMYVSGDNKKLSSKIKPIGLKQVVGRVVLKY